MRFRKGPLALRGHAKDIAVLLGSRVTSAQVQDDLDRFVNRYGIDLEEARRAVLVLHGIPPGLTGPSRLRFTWQSDLDIFC
jgi:hypothetical protein